MIFTYPVATVSSKFSLPAIFASIFASFAPSRETIRGVEIASQTMGSTTIGGVEIKKCPNFRGIVRRIMQCSAADATIEPAPRISLHIFNTMPDPSATTDNNHLLRLENVSKTFQMGEVNVAALNDVSLDIRRGELIVMVGPSGSGKTTILNLIGGLDSVTSGRLWYGEHEMTRFNAAELTRYRRETVGFVFQFYNLVPNLTAAENVMVATELSRDPMPVAEALRMVGLEERTGHFPSQLSGGEQQRVAIARALAKNPALLLCDEPTGALDFATGKLVLRTLVDLNRRLGKTVVLITHNAAIAPIADRVLRLRSGQIVECHVNEQPVPPEEVVW